MLRGLISFLVVELALSLTLQGLSLAQTAESGNELIGTKAHE